MELIPIHLYLDKVSGRYYFRVASLSKHINSLLNGHYSKEAKLYWLAIDNFTEKQRLKIKSSVVDTNNLNEIYSFFNKLHRELSPSFYLCDNFSNYFSFHKVDKKKPENICNYLKSLNKLLFNSFLNPNIIIIIADTYRKLSPLSSVNTFSNTEIGHSTGTNPVIINDVRGKSPQIHKNQSRDSSISSTVSSIIYHERMELNNSMDIDSNPPVETPALSYEEERDKAIRLSKAAESTNNTRFQSGTNETFTTLTNQGNHISAGNSQAQPPRVDNDDVINIQLPYNPNSPTEPDLWSGSFHPISLHSSIEHFASNSKSIKDSLNFIAKYIQGKQVDSGKANNLSDLNGMGDAIWNFISLVYEAK